MIYIGFDLGDGESCVTWSRDLNANAPVPVVVNGDVSFLTAVGTLNGETVIGKHAAKGTDVEDLRVCFKRHFLEQKNDVDKTVVRFVQGVLDALRQQPSLKDVIDDPQKACFIVGCPVGWKEEERSRYRRLLQQAGMKNVRLASESRAAFESAKRCHNLDEKQLNDSVLVIDIGSSTLDLAYVCDGNEYDVKTYGDTKLGGGLMDEMIVQYAIQHTSEPMASALRTVLANDPAAHSTVMMAAREMKEQYFNHEEQYFETNEVLERTVKFFADRPYRIVLKLSPEIVETYLISQPHPLLDKQSFESKLQNTIKTFHMQIRSREPKLVILTGGPSRMSFFQEMCRNEFSRSNVVISKNPEQDIAIGLAYAGSVDEGASRMLADVRRYVKGDSVEKRVEKALPDLIDKLSERMTKALLEECVLPEFRIWRNGGHDTLQEFSWAVSDEADSFFNSPEGRDVIEEVCTPWTTDLMEDVRDDLDSIAARHKVSLAAFADPKIRTLDSNSPEGVIVDPAQMLSNMIQSVVAAICVVIVAMICGGSGTALLMAGPIGIIIGAIIGLAAFFLGKDYLEDAIMSIRIPGMVRKLFKESSITTADNQTKMTNSIKQQLKDDPRLAKDLVNQISTMVDSGISKTLASTEERIVA